MALESLQSTGIYLQTIAIVLSVIFIIIGWKIFYRNAKRIASRNETYALLLKAQAEIMQTEKMGHDFWANSTTKTKAESYVLVLRIENILMLLDLLKYRGLSVDPHHVYKLRNAITLDAENPQKVSESTIQKKIINISDYSRKIQCTLHKAFLKNHPQSP